VASYNVLIKPSAAKELENLPAKPRQKIARKIQALAGDPRPKGSEKLSGEDLYRIRQGDYRILYGIQDKALSIVVIRIGHRRDVYR
jgi:mRNA interferase RelE/StbE